jgi:hypothetical protein
MRRKHLRFAAVFACIICLLAMFWPTYSHDTPSEGEERTQLQLGLPFSPWFRFEESRIDRKVESETGISHTMSRRSSTNAELVTWSSLLPLAGIGFLILARALK